jgi:RimJ/RimL family protein N-acetyltransferase
MSPIEHHVVSTLVLRTAGQLRRVPDQQAAEPLKQGEWSGKQLVGHLVDSALNNYHRIIRAQTPSHLDADGVLRFPSYEQQSWVVHGGYQSRLWSDLLDLWIATNQQLCTALQNYDSGAMNVPLSIGGGDAVPIGNALDYVEHLQHHVADLLSLVADEPPLRELPVEMVIDAELRLRLPRASDGPSIIASVQDPEIPRWTTVPSPYGEFEFNEWLMHNDKRALIGDLRRNYLIVDTNDDVLGMVGLVRVKPEDADGEVGYWLRRSARGSGVINRALTTLLREILRAGYERIEAEVLVGNVASERVLERTGFTREGLIRSVGPHGCGENAKRIDVHLFSIIRSDPIAAKLLGE